MRIWAIEFWFDIELCFVAFLTCSVIHANYEQSLVSMINTVPLKDYVGQLVTSILQLYMRNVGTENGKESKLFTTHTLIIAPEHVSFAALISEVANSSQ